MKINFKKRQTPDAKPSEPPQNVLTECLLNDDKVGESAQESTAECPAESSAHCACPASQIQSSAEIAKSSTSQTESSTYAESMVGNSDSPYHVSTHQEFNFDDSYWDELEKLLEGMAIDLDEDLLAKISSDSTDLESSSNDQLNHAGYVFGDPVDIVKESSSVEG